MYFKTVKKNELRYKQTGTRDYLVYSIITHKHRNTQSPSSTDNRTSLLKLLCYMKETKFSHINVTVEEIFLSKNSLRSKK